VSGQHRGGGGCKEARLSDVPDRDGPDLCSDFVLSSAKWLFLLGQKTVVLWVFMKHLANVYATSIYIYVVRSTEYVGFGVRDTN
jgi:hypothetical protein